MQHSLQNNNRAEQRTLRTVCGGGGGCFCVLKQRGCRTHDMNLDQTDKLNKDMHMGLGQHTQPITLLCAEIKFSD